MNTNIYMESFETASIRGETEQYFASRRLNADCAGAISKAISMNHDGYFLGKTAHEGVLKVYGLERVKLVLANTVRCKHYDGRFSSANRKWADSIALPNMDRRELAHFISDAHPAVLDGFINLVREYEVSLNAPSILEEMQSYQQNTLSQARPSERSNTHER